MNNTLEGIWKEAVVAQCFLLSLYFLGRTKRNHEKHQDGRSQGRDLNPGPPEYEAGVLTTRPRHSAYSGFGGAPQSSYMKINLVRKRMGI
jgi:K+-transporting ATPase c subunit